MSTPIRAKLTKKLDRAMSLTESTGKVTFTFNMMGNRFRYVGTVDKKGFFIPECNENEKRLLEVYTKVALQP